LLAELTDVLSDGVSQDLWLLTVGIDNNPWGQYQPLIPLLDRMRTNLKNKNHLQAKLCFYPQNFIMHGYKYLWF